MTTDTKKMVQEFINVVDSHDANKIISCFADDGVLENVPLGIVNKGKAEITAYTKSMLVDYPDINFELKSVFGSGDWAPCGKRCRQYCCLRCNADPRCDAVGCNDVAIARASGRPHVVRHCASVWSGPGGWVCVNCVCEEKALGMRVDLPN